jgi:molecular chaperone GrpE
MKAGRGVPPPEEGAGREGSPADAAGAPPSETDALRAELAALRDRHLRLQAEFDNFRKRQQREREDAHRQAKERLLRELPDVLDNLERAQRHSGAADAAPESLAQGVELVSRQLREILGRFGAEPMTALGAPFDPHRHEAMSRVPTAGDPPDGTVVEEMRRGWLLDGRVLRPALVAVATLPDEEGDAGT